MSGGKVSPAEARAFAVLESVLDVPIVPTDLAGAPAGSLDGRIDFADGRVGNVEVTSVGASGEFHLLGQMHQVRGSFDAPGDWPWVIGLGNAAEFQRVRAICSKAILICEEHRVRSPKLLPPEVVAADPDIEWLVQESRTDFFGVVLPEGAHDAEAKAHLHVLQTVPSWSRNRDGLLANVNGALHADAVSKRVSKLAAAAGDQRHLYLAVTMGGLDEGSVYELIMHSIRPEEAGQIIGDPDVPASITDLWLDVGWGSRVTRWTRGVGWSDLHFDLGT